MKMAYEKRKSMYGYCFIALWFIGALIFFLIPVVESLFYSFREVSPDTGGMVGKWVGLFDEAIRKPRPSGIDVGSAEGRDFLLRDGNYLYLFCFRQIL